jgi:hypothetical protein
MKKLSASAYGLKVYIAKIYPEDVDTGDNPKGRFKLRKNFRKIDERNLSRIKRDIEHSDFIVNGATIKVDKDGNVIDGQHRLYAVLETGMPLVTIIVEGVKNHVGIDNNKSRTLKDYLRHEGHSNVVKLAAMIHLVNNYKHGRLHVAHANSSCQQGMTVLKNHPDLPAFLARVGTHTLPISAARVAGILYCSCEGKYDPEYCDYFVDGLRSGENLSSDDPVYVLREYASRRKMDTAKGKGSWRTDEMNYAIVIAWNALLKGESLSSRQLRWVRSGPQAKPFPELLKLREAVSELAAA